MMKLTALYTQPRDPEGFEAHYLSKHAPMVDAIPGLLRQETCTGVGSPKGQPRKAPGKLIEGATTQGWKQALTALLLAYPERLAPHVR